MSPAKRVASAIPVGTQFSPALFDLKGFAQAAVANSGSKVGLEQGIWQPGVRIQAPKRRPTRRVKSLPLEAAVQYGLLKKGSYDVTDLTRKLAKLSPPDLYDEFARHILLNCGGLRVLEGIQEMMADGRDVTGDALAAYLTSQGFQVTVHNTAINTLRMWLAKAGLFPEQGKSDLWTLNAAAKARILGLGDEAIGIIASLDAEQRAFVEALCRINPSGWYSASDVRSLAEATFHLRLGRTSLPNEYLEPLRVAGLIEYKSGGTRGGKSALLRTTPLFDKDVLEVFVTRTTKDLDAAVTAYYRKRPADIYAELESSDTFKKGQALEAYAIYLMRLLGLRFLHWRKRAKETTGRAEVDAIFAGVIGAVPTRWQVQCKNTPRGRVDLEDVAKEVGLLPITEATHILLVANSRVTKDAREYATQIMNRSPVTIFLLDATDFAAVKQNPGALGSILRSKAETIVRQRPVGSLFGARS